MRSLVSHTILASSLLLASCDGDDADCCDGGRDASTAVDAGRRDAGCCRDGGETTEDGGRRDGGTPDSGQPVECPTTPPPSIGLDTITTALNSPVFVTQPPGNNRDLYVVEKGGRIRIVRDRNILPTPFLDVQRDVAGQGNEQGLLALAFHPDYVNNGRFFVYLATPRTGAASTQRNILREYRRSAGNPDVADGAPVGTPLIDVQDPAENHNGAMLAFGPDGFLYVSMGDGGGSCDSEGASPQANNLRSPFGKMHRLDVGGASRTGSAPWAAPGNPFSGAGEITTIWAYGLRNPWRFSFDRETGDMYIGDVGQGAWEEIDFQPRSSRGGENYGWLYYEGTQPSRTASDCDLRGVTEPMNHTPPIYVNSTRGSEGVLDNPLAIVGGYVYRGSIAALRGWYLFTGNNSPNVGALRVCDGMARDAQELTVTRRWPGGTTSFGEDNAGELYIVGASGRLDRIIAAQ